MSIYLGLKYFVEAFSTFEPIFFSINLDDASLKFLVLCVSINCIAS